MSQHTAVHANEMASLQASSSTTQVVQSLTTVDTMIKRDAATLKPLAVLDGASVVWHKTAQVTKAARVPLDGESPLADETNLGQFSTAPSPTAPPRAARPWQRQ
jgi:hypothetical protein